MKKLMLTGEYGTMPESSFRAIKNRNMNVPEYPTAGPAHDFPIERVIPGTVHEPFLRHGMGNGFRFVNKPEWRELEACAPEKNFIVIDTFRLPRDRKSRETWWDECFRMAEKYPDTVWLDAHGEVSNIPWPDTCFRDKKEAYNFWKDYFFTKDQLLKDYFPYLKKRGIDLRDRKIMINVASLFSVHYLYEWGFPLVWLEMSGGIGNFQLGTAFVRGAAKQYKKREWGYDFAPFHPNYNSLIFYNGKDQRVSGFTESLMLRGWMAGFLGGACFLHEQASDYSHWLWGGKDTPRLSPMGKLAKRFARFALHECPDPGKTLAPVALMLNYYHGYDHNLGVINKGPLTWYGRMPFSLADANVSNYLEFFFPGSKTSYGAWEKAWNPSLPWNTQQEFREMIKKGRDMRPYEDGYLGPSPYGDCLDVVLDNCPLDVLAKYKILILAGEQELDDGKINTLMAFIERGGLLVCGVAQIPEKMKKTLGAERLSSDWELDRVTCKSDGVVFGGMRYCYDRLKIKKGKALGHNRHRDALEWEIPYGKGKVLLSATPYAQDISATGLMPLHAHLLDKYADKVLVARADKPGLQLIVNAQKDGYLLGAINNGQKAWKGGIDLRAPCKAGGAQELWLKGKVRAARNGRGYRIQASVAPYSFKIFRIVSKRAPNNI